MFSYEEIIDYCTNYKIDNGIVIDKRNNQQILDENTILKIKSSILIFKESKDSFQFDVQQFGKTSRTQQDYIIKTMEKFSVNNEQNSYGINKLINSLLSSNGNYEEFMSGKDLSNSKFSILVPPKQEYGMAYLKLKFREKDLDISDLKISQDLTELQHNGVSKVIINFKIKKYEKTDNITNVATNSSFKHPRANDLNELERQKQIAKQNNDEVAYNYAQANIERIIKENCVEVSPENWDMMSIDDKLSFVKIKINEAKVLKDQDNFNYWNANLKLLESKKSEEQISNGASENKDRLDLSNSINQLLNDTKKIKNAYQSMMSDGYIDDYELATLIKMINSIIKNGYDLKKLATNENDYKKITIIIETLEEEQRKISRKNNVDENNGKSMK